MTGQVLLVAPERPGASATIAEALLAATDGALIQLTPGNYAEALVITVPVTLAADGPPGSVTIHAPAGSALVAEAAVRLTGLALTGDDTEASVINACGGAVDLDGCQVSGRAWAAVLAQDAGTITLRGCEVGNDYGAGIVIASDGDNAVSDTTVRDVASSGVVVAGDGRLTVLRTRIERPGGNGIVVNGQARVIVEDTSVTGAAKPALAAEDEGGADLTRLSVITDTGPAAYLASQGEITLTGCSFLVRDAAQPAVLVADGATLTLTDSNVIADGDGVQVLDGGTLTATRSRLRGAGGAGLTVAPDGHADVTSCDIDIDIDTDTDTDTGATSAASQAAEVPELEPELALPELALSEPDPAADLEFSPSARLIGDLVGLDGVRLAVSGRLADLVRLRAAGQSFTAEANLAFAGHDGSGRRAVAELYARCLVELGFLRTGALDWAPLTDFPARWPGQADRYADWLLTRSHGGLLLLEADEVFAQWPDDRRARVLAALPGAVGRFPDSVTVLSGEPGLLSAAFSDTPGLAGCFGVQARFDQYAPAELAELTVRRLAARGCGIEDGTRAALAEYFEQAEWPAEGGAPAGAWDAHRLAVYLSENAPGPEISSADVFSAMPGELNAGSPER